MTSSTAVRRGQATYAMLDVFNAALVFGERHALGAPPTRVQDLVEI